MIKEVAFKEGSEVKEGDLLYKIEDDTYRAAQAQSKQASRRQKPVPTQSPTWLVRSVWWAAVPRRCNWKTHV